MTETYRIQSLARGLAILSAVASSDGDLTAAVLSRRIGVSRQTSYHLLHTLRQTGYVEQGPGQRYRLGWAVTSLADGYTRHVAPPAIAMKRLQRLAELTGETCSLSVWSGDDVVLIAQEPGIHQVRVADIKVGQRGALHARAAAKILLARCSEERQRELLGLMDLTAFTPHTITDLRTLGQQVDHAAEAGWAVDAEELAVGVTCVAAASKLDDVDFALSVLAPTARYRANATEYVSVLLKVTGTI